MAEDVKNEIIDDTRDELVEAITNQDIEDIIKKLKYDPQSRNWIFEISYEEEFGYTDEIVIPSLQSLNPDYLVLSNLELTVKNKKKHKHGGISRNSPIRLSTLMRLLPRIHWEKMRGTMLDVRKYCMKLAEDVGKEKADTVIDTSFYEEGTIKTSEGKLSLEEQVLDYIEEYMENNEIPPSVKQIIKEFPKTAFKKNGVEGLINLYLTEKYAQERRNLINTVILSPTNVGKTTFCYNLFNNNAQKVHRIYGYDKPHALFDGYDSTANVGGAIVFDEIANHNIPEITLMNILLDDFGVLNAPARFFPKILTNSYTFLLTNAKSFSDLYRLEQTLDKYKPIYDAFVRRIHNIWEFRRELDSDVIQIIKHKHTKDIPLIEGMENIKFIEKGEF